MKKTGRNDPCPCGSGKKFKKCCESKMIGGRFMAAKVDAGSSPGVKRAAGMTALFQRQVSEISKNPEMKKTFKAVAGAVPKEKAPKEEEKQSPEPAPAKEKEKSSQEKKEIC